MKNQRMKYYGVLTLTYLLACGALLGVFFAGMYSEMNAALFTGIACACGAGFAAMIAFNAVKHVKLNRKMKNMTAEEQFRFSMDYKESVEKDYAGAEKELVRLERRGKCWIASALALLLVSAFCFGALRVETEAVVLILLMLLFPAQGLLFLLVAPPKNAVLPQKEYELARADYPGLFGVVDRAAQKIGYHGRVKLFYTAEGVNITEQGGIAAIGIDARVFAYCTQAELYQIMLHEFAHVLHADTGRSAHFCKVTERWNTDDVTLAKGLFFGYFATSMAIKFNFCQLLAMRYHEIGADDFVKTQGDPQTYTNACAKSALLKIFDYLPTREMTYDIYESETIHKDYIERNLRVFHEYLKKNETMWNYILSHELPARIDTHPTFKMRWEHMGVAAYDYTAQETDEGYRIEQTKLLRTIGIKIADMNRPDYAAMRRENYLDRTAKMKEYEEAEQSGKEIPVTELIDFAAAFLFVDMDAALRIADAILAKSPEAAYAHFYKGIALCSRYDDACIPHFYHAVRENIGFTDSAMSYIGAFALMMGRQDILDEYRANAVTIAEKSDQRNKVTKYKKKDVLTACEISEKITREVKEEILKIGKNRIAKLRYACKKTSETDVVYVAVEFRAKTALGDIYGIANEVVSYLDKRTEPFDYFFAVRNFDRNLYRAVAKASPTPVYDLKRDGLPKSAG